MDVTLAKTDAKGKRRVWRVTVVHDDDAASSTNTYTYGVEGGAMQTQSLTYTTGKVKTRSAAEQALLEARSKMTVKQREGYVALDDDASGETTSTSATATATTTTTTSSSSSPLPMLAQEFEKRKKFVNFGTQSVFIQPKLDGVRAVAKLGTGELWSRNRVEFTAPTHIGMEVKALFAALRGSGGLPAGVTDDTWLDGELYTHGKTFNEVSSLVRQKTVRDKALLHTLQYHIYDVFLPVPYAERLKVLENLRAVMPAGSPLVIVDTQRATPPNVMETITDAHSKYTAQGYEGAMVRLDTPTPYQEDKRSAELLKVKAFMQEDFVLKELVPETGAEHLVGVMIVVDHEGREVGARPAMTKKEREELWHTAHAGDIVTVKFFDYTPAGVPRFPVALGIRADTS